MPRISRAVAVGVPHHITQRGNYQQIVFSSDEDRVLYLDWLKVYSARYLLKIWAYCLMHNHVHFVAVPSEPNSMAKTFNALHMRYAQHVNRRTQASGHLWQGRFYSCALDERHLLAAVRYVENNPVRAGIVRRAEEYPWSSARSHVLKSDDPVLSGECYLLNEIENWALYLGQEGEPLLVDSVRQCTKTGRPCGDERFVRGIEAIMGRRLTALACGRPKSAK